MAYKTKFIHFKTKASYEAERAKTTEGTEERKAFDAYISFVDEGPTIYVFGKEYQCDTNSVSYTSQELTDAEKTQARTNIGAASKDAETVIIDVRDIRNPSIEKYNLAKDAFISKKHVVLLSDDSSQLPVIQMFSETTVLDPIVMYTASLTTAEQDGSTGIFGWIYEFEASGNINYTDVTISPSDIEPQPAGTASAGESLDYARADHVHPAQTDITGNAATATMANGVYENNIKLNPEVTSEDFTPMNAALIPEIGQDIFSGYGYRNDTIEYTVDGGNIWSVCENVEELNTNMFYPTNNMYSIDFDDIGTSDNITQTKVRVTIDGDYAGVISYIKKIVIIADVGRSLGCTVDLYGLNKTSGQFEAIKTGIPITHRCTTINEVLNFFADTYDNGNYPSSGIIYQQLRFIFSTTGYNENSDHALWICRIKAFGDVLYQDDVKWIDSLTYLHDSNWKATPYIYNLIVGNLKNISYSKYKYLFCTDGTTITQDKVDAGTAKTLASGRHIKLTGDVTGSTSTTFNGSNDATINTTISNISADKLTGTINANKVGGIYENNILWGNKNLTQNQSPFDCALISELRANRFAFLKPAGVSLEYSIDGGKTWLEYPNSEKIIPCLFGMTEEYILAIDPLNNKENITSLYKTRVTISCKDASIYSRLNKIVFYVGTYGSRECTVDISSCTRNSDVFTDIATGFALGGWTGYNVFNQELALGNDTDDTRISKLRFTFNITSHNATYEKGLSIIHIMAYGGVGWQTPSSIAKTGRIYSILSDQSARFPAYVYGSGFIHLYGNASHVLRGDGGLVDISYLRQATKLEYNRTFALTGAVTGSVSSNLSSNLSISTTLADIDASKITTGTIDADRLPEIPLSKIPAGALERLYVVDSETAALGLDIQEGDIVQIGSNGPMYFCISDTAMIFSAKFKPFTVGSAASVPWSGVTDKPTFASVATSGSYNDLSNKPSIPSLDGYATESWVTGKGYLTSIPVASADSVGGVKIGDNITISSDTISLTGNNIISALGYTPANINDIPEIPTSLPNPQPLVLNGESYYGNMQMTFSFVSNMVTTTLTNNEIVAGYIAKNTTVTEVNTYTSFSNKKRSAIIYSTKKITFSGSNIVKMKGLADLSGTYYIYCLELIDDTHIAINGAVYE